MKALHSSSGKLVRGLDKPTCAPGVQKSPSASEILAMLAQHFAEVAARRPMCAPEAVTHAGVLDQNLPRRVRQFPTVEIPVDRLSGSCFPLPTAPRYCALRSNSATCFGDAQRLPRSGDCRASSLLTGRSIARSVSAFRNRRPAVNKQFDCTKSGRAYGLAFFVWMDGVAPPPDRSEIAGRRQFSRRMPDRRPSAYPIWTVLSILPSGDGIDRVTNGLSL